MKWKEFRELPPLERRRQRRSKSHGMQARQRFFRSAAKQLPEGDFEKYPDIRRAVEIIWVYANANTDEQIVEWLKWRVPLSKGRTCAASEELLKLGKLYPATIFGFFNEDNAFVPGILPLMAHQRVLSDLYPDPLDDILSEEALSGMIIDEVVAMAAKRGMKACNAELVRQRVRFWDAGKPEISPEKSHTR